MTNWSASIVSEHNELSLKHGLFCILNPILPGEGGRKCLFPCVSKSILAIEMKLIWYVKHPKMYILVTVTCQLWRYIMPKWRHTFKKIRHLGNVRKSPNLIWKSQEKYADVETVQILEESLNKKQKSYKNQQLSWKHQTTCQKCVTMETSSHVIKQSKCSQIIFRQSESFAFRSLNN